MSLFARRQTLGPNLELGSNSEALANDKRFALRPRTNVGSHQGHAPYASHKEEDCKKNQQSNEMDLSGSPLPQDLLQLRFIKINCLLSRIPRSPAGRHCIPVHGDGHADRPRMYRNDHLRTAAPPGVVRDVATQRERRERPHADNSSYSQCDLLNSVAMALNEYRDCRQLMSLAGCLRQFERGARDGACASDIQGQPNDQNALNISCHAGSSYSRLSATRKLGTGTVCPHQFHWPDPVYS